jgi:hypothetical protein
MQAMKSLPFFAMLLVFLILSPGFSYTITNDGPDPQRKLRGQEQALMFATNPLGRGMEIVVDFRKGRAHNHPLMAIWLEDMDGNYIQTLYVAQSIATSTFRHGSAGWQRWEAATVRRPAALPYWGHKRGIKAEDGFYLPTPENPVPDAYTGATPKSDFILQTRADGNLPAQFRVMLEINQSWDWNHYWTNDKFPDDPDYKTSSQPALVYEAVINTESQAKDYEMKAIGHSHYAGRDGRLYTDLSTITTALDISEKIIVRIR